ncbi:putative short-chain dehydrogenase reductase family protein-3 [Coleophoma cylindrospora]|uniref:Putative short-chain dehydrogenase reductase family protein-3 n=1 Tax=Coleophoma cylindrospora TaxID=1849047 RepID=A0A3D8STW0_9HELO|nr:putative short-chain dehydrogenase reductase family protein-3 [Coleophoma cylindrospora]
MSASFDLGPPTRSARSLFLESQFYSSVQWPPQNTSLEGRVAIVTGSSSGLGLEASCQLLSLGLSSLIIAVRSTEKGEQVASKFRAEYPKSKIQVWSLEMESYDSIQAFAHRVEVEISRLDIAILNAGMQTANFSTTPSTGHEKLVQVNYLSTMLLGILLLPALKTKSPLGTPGRLSVVSSGTARGAKICTPKGMAVLPALDKPSSWHPVERYAVSKLLGHLFMVSLVQHVSADDVIINLVDPGLVKDTGLQGFAPLPVRIFFYCFKAVLGRKLSVGASTYVDAAVVKGKESHGCYVANWKISP